MCGRRHHRHGLGRRGRRFPNREEWIRRLEERQRDLDLADFRDFGVDVSSPGIERPLRKPEHFQQVVGKQVKLKTAARSKLRGEVRRADEEAVTVAADSGEVDVPYEQIVRANLIDEGK